MDIYKSLALLGLAVSGAFSNSLTVDLGYASYKGTTDVHTGINSWKGIRYAAAPIDNLRWQPPQIRVGNKTADSKPLPAIDFGPICPQSYPGLPPGGQPPFVPSTEDCLFLNVYASDDAEDLLPVMVWFHGGGYGIGNGRTNFTDLMMANKKGNGFVAVSVQYRLGAFGYLSSEEVYQKGVVNAGTLDQEFALKWVKTHIRQFGGDAKRVTIAGVSAGGNSIILHIMAKEGKMGTSLFTNAIALSPGVVQQHGYNDRIPTAYYDDFVSAAGCADARDHFGCLTQADTLVLQKASTDVSASGAFGNWAFNPVTDGKYIQQLPSKQLFAGRTNGKNLLVGHMANEGALLVPGNITTQADLTSWLRTTYPLLDDSAMQRILDTYPSTPDAVNPDDSLYATSGFGPGTAINISQLATGQQQRAFNIYSEAAFICPTYSLASSYTSHKKQSAYKFQYSVPLGSHGDDQAVYFGPGVPEYVSPGYAYALRRMMGNHIRTGNPSLSLEEAGASIPSSRDASSGSTPVIKHKGVDEAVVDITNWPVYSRERPVQLNFNQTGGEAYTARDSHFKVAFTQFRGLGLRNWFKAVDAVEWEGGRGRRCDFWRGMTDVVPA